MTQSVFPRIGLERQEGAHLGTSIVNRPTAADLRSETPLGSKRCASNKAAVMER